MIPHVLNAIPQEVNYDFDDQLFGTKLLELHSQHKRKNVGLQDWRMHVTWLNERWQTAEIFGKDFPKPASRALVTPGRGRSKTVVD